MKYIIKILLLLFVFNHTTVVAKEPPDHNVAVNQKQTSLANPSVSEKIRKLETNPQWQRFVKERELADLNYDLYRVEPDLNIDPKMLGAQDPRSYFIGKHYTVFCSPKVEENNCHSSSLYEYADLRASLLLDQNIYNMDQYSLLTEITRNIVNPFPSIMPIEMKNATVAKRNDEVNKVPLSEALASQARLAVARNSFNQIILNRLPLNLLDKSSNNNAQNNFSVLSIMEQEAKKRFENEHWQQEVEQYNQEKLLKEMVKMEAFKMWMEYYKYKQNERIEALLATMLAQQNTLNQTLIERGQNK